VGAIEVCRPETKWFVSFVNGVAQIMGSPPALVLEQSYCTDSALLAEVEPMSGTKGHANHITTPNLNTEDRSVARVNMKHATSLQNETDFVFCMSMFLVELIKHGTEVWCVWVDVNNICCNKSTLLFRRRFQL